MVHRRVRLTTPTLAVDVVALAVLFAIGCAAFGPVFDGGAGYLAAGGGVLVGFAVALLAAATGLGRVTTAAVLVVAFVVFGGALALPRTTVAGFVPTVDTMHRLVLLTVQAWRDLLTVSTPASEFTGPAVVPLLAAMVCGCLAVGVVARTRRPLWSLVPATALLAVGILWGLADDTGAVVRGVAFGVCALAWAGYRQARARVSAANALLANEPARGVAVSIRPVVVAVVTLGLAAVTGGFGAPAVADAHRNVLRDHVVPPFDPHQYASPLTMYRYLERSLHDSVVLTVSGLPAGARIPLASMDAYDGMVYNVGGDSAAFRRIGGSVSGPYASRTTVATVHVTVGDYDGPWIPGAGDLHAVDFDDPDRFAESVYYNESDSTALTTVGLVKGTGYTVTTGFSRTADAKQLEKATPSASQLPEDTNVPDVIAKLAGDLSADAATPFQRLKAIETKLKTQGFYSDGADGHARAGHTAERLTTMFSAGAWVGDDEQYAAAMALMARQLGLPARVVMGFYPQTPSKSNTLQIKGSDAHVWVQVAFDGTGWVDFDPTPPRDRTTKTEVPKPRQEPKPQVLPPPESLKDPDVPAPAVEPGKKPPNKDGGTAWWLAVLEYVGIVVAGLGVALAPFLTVVLGKRRRSDRRRRSARPADRANGGWSEILDQAADFKIALPRSSTRQENAAVLADSFPTVGVTTVAERIDSDVFGEREPEDHEIEALWREVDEVLDGMRGAVSRRRRLLARLSVRSVVRSARERRR